MQFAKEKCLNFICLLKSWKEKEEEPLKHSFGMISSKIDYKVSVASLNFAFSVSTKVSFENFQMFYVLKHFDERFQNNWQHCKKFLSAASKDDCMP